MPDFSVDRLILNLVVLIVVFFVFLIPLALILLANLGERSSGARVLSTVGVALICLLVVSCGPLTLISAFVEPTPGQPRPMSPLVGAFAALVFMGTGLLALLPLIPYVRRLLAYILPIRAESVVNGLALSLSILVIGASFAQLPMTSSIANPTEDSRQLLDMFVTLPLFWLQGLMFVLYGFFGVGWLVRRGWRDTLSRLGLGRLTATGLSVAISAWIGLFVMDLFISLVWRSLSPGAFEQFGDLTDTLFGPFISIPGAITIGLSAGIGEEILFRGALQPRFGIPLTSFMFMIVHAQYGFTPAILQILIVGFVIGLIRRYTNTTACILVHTLYNATSVLVALYFPNLT